MKTEAKNKKIPVHQLLEVIHTLLLPEITRSHTHPLLCRGMIKFIPCSFNNNNSIMCEVAFSLFPNISKSA